MIISHLAAQPEIWSEMISPPILVSKGNVMIGYNPIYEYAALPDVERIVAALKQSMSISSGRVVAAGVDRGHLKPAQTRAESAAQKLKRRRMGKPTFLRIARKSSGADHGRRHSQRENCALLKKPGEPVELDDPLCEVETDKAVYPIESSFAGTMGEWKTEVGATVDIGQEIGTILSSEVIMG